MIAAGITALVVRPSPAWVERAYVNGGYALWERTAFHLTSPIPWSLGDVAVVAGVVSAAFIVLRAVRQMRARGGRVLPDAALTIATLAGLYAVWFVASWGWCYDRAPVTTRVVYRPEAVNPDALARLRREAIAQVNALAPLAHARAAEPLAIGALRAAWLPVVRAMGDEWRPAVGAPKATLAAPFLAASGTEGFINPFTLEAQLAPDLLWFEVPFALAHEWTHLAGFAREDEANYAAIVACLRSHDPVQRYSGWLELFLYLPPLPHYPRSTFSPLVWSDFAAIRARNARHVNLTLARWSWRTYDAYLQANHVAAGIANYGEVTQLLLGIERNARGLPVSRSSDGSTR